jgi:hypothetical protein
VSAKIYYFEEERDRRLAGGKPEVFLCGKCGKETDMRLYVECGKCRTCCEERCAICCGHEWDSAEGGMCLNCDSEYPY